MARYQAAIAAEAAIATEDRWADGRTFSFDRVLPVPLMSSGGTGSTRRCSRHGGCRRR
ncbi:hypothetical protein GCM10029964_124010 [Kibdelosporangium lantanae]